MHFGQEGGDRALAPQLHLHIQGEVPGLQHRPLQRDHSGEGVESACAKVTLLVASRDGQRDGVAREGRRGADAEDVRRHQQAGLEVELVVGDSCRRVLALQQVMARGALTLPAERDGA